MHYQIQIAEQALREMRMSLHKQRAAGAGGLDITSQQYSNQQTRPKSQNDAQSYSLQAHHEVAPTAEALSQDSKALDPGHEALSGQSRGMGAARDRRDRDRTTPRAQMTSPER